jgi:hypothetical protein
LDRSQKWLSFVEAGKIRLDEPTAAKILAAIERLLSLDEMPISQVKVDDLALPRRS